jgi:hypothetical protein
MATVGQQLPAPEAGWKRYDDNTPYFVHSSSWTYYSGGSYYGGGAWYTTSANQTLKFDFVGTKIRLIYPTFSNRSSNIKISIDGVEEFFSEYSSSAAYNVLVYEKTGLQNARHKVVITTTENSKEVGIDAIDIDSTGRLLHPDEVTDPKDLAIGKRIRCHYQAPVSGQVGIFSSLGQETSDFIPASSNATPNGDFYLIAVDQDYFGRWKLIADRNVQNIISWDALNTAGIASGSGLPVQEIANIGLFTSIVYVDPVNGNDSNNGSSNSPVRTLNRAISISGQGGAVILLPGVHIINTANQLLHDLCTAKGLTYIGYGLQTVIEVPNCQLAYNQPAGTSAYFYNLVIRPSNSLSGDTRMIWYNVQGAVYNYVLRFTNVTFTKSLNGSYPTQWYFAWTNVGAYNPNVLFNNCSFIPVPSSVESGGGYGTGVVRYVNCAFGNTNSLPSGSTSGCAFNVTFDSNNHIASGGSDSSQGVYSGTFSWSTFTINASSSVKYILRLLTGGISSTDKDNEWDQYIVNSTLNGTITPGDNGVWNWNGVYSWTSTTQQTVSNASGNRIVRGNSSNSYLTQTPSSNTFGFRPVIVIQQITEVKKYLFQDGTDIKKYVPGTGWIVVGTAPATQSMFDTDGMTDLSVIDSTAIQQLVSSQPKLLMWTSQQNPTANATLTVVPKEHLVIPTGDIAIPAQGITGFTLTSTATGLSSLKILASVDSGATWKAWNGSAWVAVDVSDLSNVKASGMTPSTFNALTEANWNALLNGGNKIRFAYYLDQDKSTDTLNVDLLTMNVKSVATQTPTLDSLKVTYDELTIEGRLQDLEQINAINISKLNFKSNALLASSAYNMYDMVVDTFEAAGTVDTSATTATYDPVNKQYTAPSTGAEVILPTQDLPSYRKKLMLNPDHVGNVSYEYSLDDGATWTPVNAFTIIDLSGTTGTKLKIKAKLLDSNAKLRGMAFSWF